MVDSLQEHLSKPRFDIIQVQQDISSTRSTTRRLMQSRPNLLGQLLGSLEGLEQEVVDFFNEFFSDSNKR